VASLIRDAVRLAAASLEGLFEHPNEPSLHQEFKKAGFFLSHFSSSDPVHPCQRMRSAVGGTESPYSQAQSSFSSAVDASVS
jgi:hypothetical protein